MYVPLRVHSPYSVGFGAVSAADLAAWCQSEKIPAAGVADRDTIGGVMANAKVLSKAGVQPMAGGVFRVRFGRFEGDIVLYARNQDGYAAILRVANAWNLTPDTVRMAPSIAKMAALMGDGAAGVLALTGGDGGLINVALAADADVGADVGADAMRALGEVFGDALYVEIQRPRGETLPSEAALRSLAADLGLPLAATSPALYATQDMREAHDAYLCVADKTYLASSDRRFSPEGAHLIGAAEMTARFQDIPEAIANTSEIARRAAFMIEPVAPRTPAFPVAAGQTEEAALREAARSGMKTRLKARRARGDAFVIDDYKTRLDYELDVIVKMGFSGYFLIVADFIAWARTKDIPVGPGRGSGAGSLVAFSLGITDINPIDFGLLFERFLNPDRVSMPDFDIDFAQGRREEVIDYVRSRYGEAHVAHIATFGTLAARAAVRDVGRVMQVPFPLVDRFAKMIPQNPADPVTLAEAMDGEILAEELAAAPKEVRALFATALRLEGLYRHVSTHAAGVIISDRPIADVVPVHRDANGKVATSFDMKAVEAAGLVKFDFLGLKNLDIIKAATDLVAATKNETVDFDMIGFEDGPTYAALADGDGFAAFQLESMGMRRAMRDLQVSDIEELIALISLYRPGPMDQIGVYAAVKRGEQEARYRHPEMETVLSPTRGVMIYQEQVMECARRLAGYSLGEADLLRRAMGKKIKAEMDAQEARFVDGCAAGWVDVTTDSGEMQRVHALTRVAALDGSGRRLTLEQAMLEGVEVAL